MKIGIPKETDDKRVAVVPPVLSKIKALGVEILIEKDAGAASSYPDETFSEHATICSREQIFSESDIIISINPLGDDDLGKIKKGTLLISLFQPYFDDSIIAKLKSFDLQGVSMDMVPRTTLAQSMDVLSSMAAIAGYKAVLTAADHLPRYFPMMITAAGSVKPAKVLVLGAGVAGLQAIATAKRLGSMVEAFDVRKAAKEEVESLGAKFVEVEGAKDDKDAGGYAVEQSEDFLKRQQAEVQKRAMNADVVITTAQVRGRKSPVLVPATTVEKMKDGSVIVDLAASTGGNCELTQDNKIINHNGVTIIGDSNLAAHMPQDASLLFSNNVLNFLKLIIKDGVLELDPSNEIVGSALITKNTES
jgi:proton-translocating NAD(P)+ transhydrogenase subunit alpha